MPRITLTLDVGPDGARDLLISAGNLRMSQERVSEETAERWLEKPDGSPDLVKCLRVLLADRGVDVLTAFEHEAPSSPVPVVVDRKAEGNDEPHSFVNYYECDHEGTSKAGEPAAAWEDAWSCACDDRCPCCNKSVSPHCSEGPEPDPDDRIASGPSI